jgi:hypothetical protein
MAGVKITALPELLTAPVSGDKLVIVDVSDTSEAPTGTTKNIDVDLLGIPTNGTWTPSITNQSGAATITVIGTSRYTQVGSVVTDICRLSVEMDTGQSLEEFNLSCAVLPATNFASTRDIIPFWSAVSAISEFDTVNVGAVASQKYGLVQVTMNGTALTAEFTVQRIYSIL